MISVRFQGKPFIITIIQDENDTFLADFESKKVASLGDVIVTDKVGKTAYGTMTVVSTTVGKNPLEEME